jgi:hypothetical protein
LAVNNTQQPIELLVFLRSSTDGVTVLVYWGKQVTVTKAVFMALLQQVRCSAGYFLLQSDAIPGRVLCARRTSEGSTCSEEKKLVKIYRPGPPKQNGVGPVPEG